MTATACPYCRASIEDSEESLVCGGCETPHHKDCYEENGGCTVFGCRCAPADEPKVSVSMPEVVNLAAVAAAVTEPSSAPPPPPPAAPMSVAQLQEIANRVVPSMFSLAETALPPSSAVEPLNVAQPEGVPKSRMGFMILGALLGALGAHNWYAGYYKKAAAQLALTALTLGYGGAMSWIWAIIDICTVDRDSRGVQFSS